MSNDDLENEVYDTCKELEYITSSAEGEDMFTYCGKSLNIDTDFYQSGSSETHPHPTILPFGRLNLNNPYVCGCYYPQWVYDSYVDELIARGSQFDEEEMRKKLSTVEGRQCFFPPCANSICQPSRKPDSDSDNPFKSNEAGPCPDINIGECFQSVQMTGKQITWVNSPTNVGRSCKISFGEADSEAYVNGGVEVGGQGTKATSVKNETPPWNEPVKSQTITVGICLLLVVFISIIILWWGFGV